MFAINEQFANAARTPLANHISALSAFTSNQIESTRYINHLNTTFTKASCVEYAITARKLFGAKDPREVLDLIAEKAGSMGVTALAYYVHCAFIKATEHAEFNRVRGEQIAGMGRKVPALIDVAFPTVKAMEAGMNTTTANRRSQNAGRTAK